MRRGMRARALLLLLVPAAVAAGYGPALRNDLVWDDHIHVLESPAVREARWGEIATRPVGSYYRPVVFASFALEARAVGLVPAVLHGTNLVLHALVAGLLLAAALALGAGHRAALGGSLLFALHPVQSEAVLYVSGRTDLLAGLFALAALLLHVRGAGWRGASPRPGARVGAALCFGLALGCKESVALLPAAFACGDRLFGGEGARPPRAALLGAAPYLIVLAGYLGWRASLPGEGLVLGGLADAPARVAASLAAVAGYARLLVLPVGLHLERFVSGAEPWPALIGLLLLAAALLGARRGRAALRFWLAWAALAYLPTSNLVPVYPGLPAGVVFAPEHFLYLPSTGLLMAFALVAAERLPRRTAVAALAAVSSIFVAILHDRARDWHDEETLYRHTLVYAPQSARVRLNLGNLLLARGETRRAAAEFAEGLRHHPDDPDLLTNAGIAWMSLGRFEPALGALGRVVVLAPDDAQAWANLGAVYGSTGRWDQARESYRKALTLNPVNADARAGLRLLDARVPPHEPTVD